MGAISKWLMPGVGIYWSTVSRRNWTLESVGFVEGGKSEKRAAEKPRKQGRERTTN